MPRKLSIAFFKAQKIAARTAAKLPEPVLSAVGQVLDPNLANADAHMRVLMGVNRASGHKLITTNLKKSRKNYEAVCIGSRDATIQMHEVETLTLDHPEVKRGLKMRRYVPNKPSGNDAMLVFFHGGGFALGSLETHDEFCRLFARESGMQVLSLDYRLAPEHPAPAAIMDCELCLGFAFNSAARFGVSTKRIAVGGDSAGGNLAAVITQQTRGSEIQSCAQLLIYPTTDTVKPYPSHDRWGTGYTLSFEDMSLFESIYMGKNNPLSLTDPLIAPIRGDLKKLPPALVVIAEIDVLSDEGVAYAQKLESAGVKTQTQQCFGLPHGFIHMIGLHEGSKQACIQMAKTFSYMV